MAATFQVATFMVEIGLADLIEVKLQFIFQKYFLFIFILGLLCFDLI